MILCLNHFFILYVIFELFWALYKLLISMKNYILSCHKWHTNKVDKSKQDTKHIGAKIKNEINYDICFFLYYYQNDMSFISFLCIVQVIICMFFLHCTSYYWLVWKNILSCHKWRTTKLTNPDTIHKGAKNKNEINYDICFFFSFFFYQNDICILK